MGNCLQSGPPAKGQLQTKKPTQGINRGGGISPQQSRHNMDLINSNRSLDRLVNVVQPYQLQTEPLRVRQSLISLPEPAEEEQHQGDNLSSEAIDNELKNASLDLSSSSNDGDQQNLYENCLAPPNINPTKSYFVHPQREPLESRETFELRDGEIIVSHIDDRILLNQSLITGDRQPSGNYPEHEVIEQSVVRII